MPHHILVPAKIIRSLVRVLTALKDVGSLVVRLWVAKIFIVSGLTKIAYWPGTIVLFKYQYNVPFFISEHSRYFRNGC